MGRYSRFPAVNREPEEVQAVPAPTVAPESVVEEIEEVEEVVVVDAPEATEAPGISEDISEMNTKEVLKWVGDDPDRLAYALEAEVAGKARKTLLRKLRGA